MNNYNSLFKLFYCVKYSAVMLVAGFWLCQPCFLFAESGFSTSGDAWSPYHRSGSSSKNNRVLKSETEDGLLIRLGKFDLHPHFTFRIGYSDNVYFDQTATEDTYVSFAPGIMLMYGESSSDHLSMDYTYESVKYQNEKELDYDGHLFDLNSRFVSGNYQLNLSDRFSNNIERDFETSELVARVQNVENLSISREISSKSSWVFDQRYELYSYDDDRFLGYSELWLGGDLFHQTFRKIKTFAGGGYGIVRMDDSNIIGDADYVELNAGLRGQLFNKTKFHAMGGWQNRTFEDDIEAINDWSLLVRVFSRLSHRTFWAVDVSRRLTPSSKNEGFTRVSTLISPSVRHILWQDRFSASISGVYEVAGYYGPQGDIGFSDDFWRVTGELDWHVFELCQLSVGCEYSKHEFGVEDEAYDETHVFVRALVR